MEKPCNDGEPESQSRDSGSPRLWGLNPLVVGFDSATLPDLHSRWEDTLASLNPINDQGTKLCLGVDFAAPSKVQDDVNDRKDHRNIFSSHQDRNHSKISPDAKEQRAGLSSLKNDSDESGRAENDSQDGRNEGASETDHDTLKEAVKAIPNLGVDHVSGLKLEPVACCPNFAPLKYIRHSGQCLLAMSDEDISKLTLTTTTNVSHSDGEQPGETETLNWVQHSSSSGNRVLVFKVNSGSLHTKMLKLRKGKYLESIIILEKLENNLWSISIQIAVYRITFSKCVGQSVEDTENVGSQKRISSEEPNYRVNIDISIGGKGKVLSWNVPLMSKTRGNTKRAIPPPIRKRHLESYYEFMMHVPEGLGVVQLKAEDIEYLGSNDRDVSRKEHEEATKRLRVR